MDWLRPGRPGWRDHRRCQRRRPRRDDRRRGNHARGSRPRQRHRHRLGVRPHRGLRRRKQRLLDVTVTDLSIDQKTEALFEALPYITQFVGKTIVVKVGGSVGEEGTVLDDVIWLKRL